MILTFSCTCTYTCANTYTYIPSSQSHETLHCNIQKSPLVRSLNASSLCDMECSEELPLVMHFRLVLPRNSRTHTNANQHPQGVSWVEEDSVSFQKSLKSYWMPLQRRPTQGPPRHPCPMMNTPTPSTTLCRIEHSWRNTTCATTRTFGTPSSVCTVIV